MPKKKSGNGQKSGTPEKNKSMTKKSLLAKPKKKRPARSQEAENRNHRHPGHVTKTKSISRMRNPG
jgi:hypothetical protein